MLTKIFGWLFGRFQTPGRIDELYSEFNEHTGKKEWFRHCDFDCSICGAPGFECDSINECRYCP